MRLIILLITLFTFDFAPAQTHLQSAQALGQTGRNQITGKGLEVPDTLYVDSNCFAPNIPATATGTTVLVSEGGQIKKSGCQCVFHVRDSVSANALRNSFTTPFTLIPAPGAGLFNKILQISAYYHFGTAAYTYNSFATTVAYYSGTNDTLDLLASFSGILVTDSNDFTTFAPEVTHVTRPQDIVNAALLLSTTRSNPPTGDGYLIIYLDWIEEQW
jgi:hypothetical protein